MTSKEKQLYSVMSQVRVCFNQLKTLAEQFHVDLGVNPSMRAVMEALADDIAKTVPEIARSKSVSRQHIQVNMDALLEQRMVEAKENPAHKRSPLYVLSKKGQSAFSFIRKREETVLVRLAGKLPLEAIETTAHGLTALNEQLNKEIEKGTKND